MGLSVFWYFDVITVFFPSRAKITCFFSRTFFLRWTKNKRKSTWKRDRDTVNYYIISHYEITFRWIVRMHTRQEFKLRLRDDTWYMRGLNRLLCLLTIFTHKMWITLFFRQFKNICSILICGCIYVVSAYAWRFGC